MSEVSVLIVDDHEVVREGLKTVLQRHPSLCVAGDVGSGHAACEAVARLRPDIVIMDLSMAGMSGTEATRRIVASSPQSRVIALTAHEEVPYVRELVAAGAKGYVLKRAVLANLLRAIEVVAGGGTFLDPELANRAQATVPDADIIRAARELSTREIEVASLTARGHSNAAIATELTISVKTVETHKARLMAKLGLQTRAQLVRYAMYRGWL